MTISLFVGGLVLLGVVFVCYVLSETETSRLHHVIAALRADLNEERQGRQEVEQDRDNAHAEINSLKTTIQRLTRECRPDAVKQLQVELARQREEYAAQSAELARRVEESEVVNTRLHDECDGWMERVRKTEGDLQRMAVRYEEAEHARKVADQRLVSLTLKHSQLESMVRQLDASNGELIRERDTLRGRIHALEEAIVQHRNAKGHQRCRLNDYALYRAYDPELPEVDPAGGESLPELMAGCAAFWLGQLGMADRVPARMEIDKKDVMS